MTDYPFATDGCSGGIYRTLFRREPPWRNCCVDHDRLYHEGGSLELRRVADIELMACVARNGHPVVAFGMWCAVRIAGHPLLPLPWRWGYGWKFPRRYAKESKP